MFTKTLHVLTMRLCVLLLINVKVIYTIYVPNDNVDKKTLATLGIKTIGWQDPYSSEKPITIHQDYSNVAVQHHTNADNLESVYEDNRRRKDPTRETGYVGRDLDQQQVENLGQKLEDFGQKTEDVDQQTITDFNSRNEYDDFDVGLTTETVSVYKALVHLIKKQNNATQGLTQKTDDLEQKQDDLEQKPDDFEQKPDDYEQKTHDFEQTPDDFEPKPDDFVTESELVNVGKVEQESSFDNQGSPSMVNVHYSRFNSTACTGTNCEMNLGQNRTHIGHPYQNQGSGLQGSGNGNEDSAHQSQGSSGVRNEGSDNQNQGSTQNPGNKRPRQYPYQSSYVGRPYQQYPYGFATPQHNRNIPSGFTSEPHYQYGFTTQQSSSNSPTYNGPVLPVYHSNGPPIYHPGYGQQTQHQQPYFGQAVPEHHQHQWTGQESFGSGYLHDAGQQHRTPKQQGFHPICGSGICVHPQQTYKPHNFYSGRLQTVQKDTTVYSKCPPGQTGQFAYELSCNQFLNCHKGHGHAQNCAAGTLFNPRTLECDFAEKVECLSGPQNARLNLGPISEKLQATCPIGFSGIIPHYKDCSKFINCANGIENLMDCAPGTIFDVKSNMCDYPHKSECVNARDESSKQGGFIEGSNMLGGTGSTGAGYGPTGGHWIVRQNSYGGEHGLGHRVDTQQRTSSLGGQGSSNGYKYQQGTSSTGRYGSGTQNQWDDQNQQGLFSSGTQGSYHGGATGNQYQQGSSVSSSGADGMYHHGSSSSGTQYQQGTHQNQQGLGSTGTHGSSQNYWQGHNQHHHSSQYHSSHGTGQNYTKFEKLTQNQNPKCPNGYTGLSEHPHDCSKFLNCAGGGTVIQDCAPGTLFNPTSKICDFPYKVQCNNQQTLQTTGQSYNQTNNQHGYNRGQSTGRGNQYGHQQGYTQSEDLSGQGSNWHQQNDNCTMNHHHGYHGSSYYNQNSTRAKQYWQPGQNPHHSEHYHNYHSHDHRHGHDPQYHRYHGHNPQYHHGHRQNSHSINGTNVNEGGYYWHNHRLDNHTQNGQSQTGNSHWRPMYHGQNHDFQRPAGQNEEGTGNSQWRPGQSGQNGVGTASNQGQSGHTNEKPREHVGGGNPSGQGEGHPNPGWISTTQESSSGQGWSPHNQGGSYPNEGSTSQWNSGYPDQHQQGSSQWPIQQKPTFPPTTVKGGQRIPNQNWPQFQPKLPTHGKTIDQNTLDVDEDSYHTNVNLGTVEQVTQRTRPNGNRDLVPGSTGNPSAETFEGSPPKSTHWPPPFPSTDVNADYVFEYDDLDVAMEPPEVPAKPQGSGVENWCNAKGFECGNKVCVAPGNVCDGKKDCPNGKDETDCDTALAQFVPTPNTKLAVKEVDRIANVTVKSCAKCCVEHDKNLCKSFNYRKYDRTCFLLTSNVGLSGMLIILPNYDYYEGTKYLVNCAQGHLCGNRKCITKAQLCDGVNDCGDRMDEKNCTPEAFGYKLQLAGSEEKNSGRIEVQAFGKTGYICDDMFGLRNADVVCRELGYPLGALEVKGNSFFAEDVDEAQVNYLMDDVVCLGNETSLIDCDFSGWGVHNCRNQEIVGVVCKTPLETCPQGHWQCHTGKECLQMAFVCDGVYDCTDKSDESSMQCDAPEEVRLASGMSVKEGRVEIRHHGIWGTVCDDDFNDDAAKVVCHQLGFQGSAVVKKDGYFGPGSGPIWLDQVFCRGNESSVTDCIHWDWGENNCDHNEDVGVICSTHETSGKPRNINLDPEDLPDVEVLPTVCGFRKDAIFREESEVHFRVVKGSAARQGDYPWQASIRVQGKSKPTHWCGAVVISKRFVLTAAHCLVGFTKGAYFVVAGDYNVDTPEGTEQEAFIEDFLVHEEFRNGTKMNNDIALIKLKGGGFKITGDVQPICLPEADINYEQGMNCTISGFGSVESGKSRASRDLRAGWIPVQSIEVCKMPHIYGSAVTNGMLCAGSLDEGVDACDGDSGGPLACLRDGYFTLLGLTSWGQHCGQANKPGVYVKVAHYRNWIEKSMKKLM